MHRRKRKEISTGEKDGIIIAQNVKRITLQAVNKKNLMYY